MGTHVARLFRYPVKSMGGESLDRAALTANGIHGDRAWAVRDEVRGGIRGAKRFSELMRCSARYSDAPAADGRSSPAEITLPDGTIIGTGDAGIAATLSEVVGNPVSFWPLMPADALDHYRRGAPVEADMETELRRIFARTADEPLPELAGFPRELMQYESPPGTYFDAYPLLLLTTSALATLTASAPGSAFDVRRFRPNILLETTEAGFPEDAWAGRRLTLGTTVLEAQLMCPRCIMTTHGFADLERDPAIMRALVREHDGNLGIYASVIEPGEIRVGDELRLVDHAA